MKTITIQIGNSDDKLTQAEWARFVDAISKAIFSAGCQVHFFGGSVNWATWQNVAWVLNGREDQVAVLKEKVAVERRFFQQVSAAWTEGETVFI